MKTRCYCTNKSIWFWNARRSKTHAKRSLKIASKSRFGGSKIKAWSLQNRSPEPPKSSLEPSKMQFLKNLNLRGSKRSSAKGIGGQNEPTWLQVGGPRPSKIEAETRKNRCWKKHGFWHRFSKSSDLVLERFLVGFFDRKCTEITKKRFLRNP